MRREFQIQNVEMDERVLDGCRMDGGGAGASTEEGSCDDAAPVPYWHARRCDRRCLDEATALIDPTLGSSMLQLCSRCTYVSVSTNHQY